MTTTTTSFVDNAIDFPWRNFLRREFGTKFQLEKLCLLVIDLACGEKCIGLFDCMPGQGLLSPRASAEFWLGGVNAPLPPEAKKILKI